MILWNAEVRNITYITMGHSDIHGLDNVIMMVADGLVPNRHQVITNYYGDRAVTTIKYMLHTPE